MRDAKDKRDKREGREQEPASKELPISWSDQLFASSAQRSSFGKTSKGASPEAAEEKSSMEKTRVVVHAAVQFALSRIKECKKELASEMNKISALILTNEAGSSRRAEKDSERPKKTSIPLSALIHNQRSSRRSTPRLRAPTEQEAPPSEHEQSLVSATGGAQGNPNHSFSMSSGSLGSLLFQVNPPSQRSSQLSQYQPRSSVASGAPAPQIVP